MIFSIVSTNPGVLLYNVLQFLTICGIYKGEIDNPMPYSKFGMTKGEKSNVRVPSKIAMLIIYVPATIVAFVFQFVVPQLASMSYKPTTAGWMVFAHFLKRDAEVLFVHKYSGDAEINTARLIGLSYAINAFTICLLSNPGVSTSDTSCKFGTLLFAIGSLGNLYHHHLLALLRSVGNSKTATKEYRAPNGGLFEYVATPHYFFELVAWLGISVASQHLTSHLTFVSMTCYLCARAYNQNQWNKKKFDEKEWPSSRKNLIPFLY
jgi:protein-S-isoprenylcysteine O-methyltransferase Ste14